MRVKDSPCSLTLDVLHMFTLQNRIAQRVYTYTKSAWCVCVTHDWAAFLPGTKSQRQAKVLVQMDTHTNTCTSVLYRTEGAKLERVAASTTPPTLTHLIPVTHFQKRKVTDTPIHITSVKTEDEGRTPLM
jgi:hypothetical protein